MIKVAVLYGGRSREREISIKSGKLVSQALRKLGYQTYEIDTIEPINNWLEKLLESDCAFLALHGHYGEDGKIQGLLDFVGIPYTSSNSYTSCICFDKYLAKLILKDNTITTPDFLLLREPIETSPFGYPCVLKPRYGGSSIDVRIIHNPREFKEQVKELLVRNDQLILEEFIDGKEITVSIVENSRGLQVLPILELRPKREFYDYVAKYTKGMTDFVVPAEIPDKLYREIEEVSKRIFTLFNCEGFIRIDGKVMGQNFYVFEINTIPGLTELSDVPMSAKAANISYEKLIEKIVQITLKKGGRKDGISWNNYSCSKKRW